MSPQFGKCMVSSTSRVSSWLLKLTMIRVPNEFLALVSLGGFQAVTRSTFARSSRCSTAAKAWEEKTEGMGVWLKQSKVHLVGGWTNPFEKYARQNGNLPQIGVRIKKYLKPPTSAFSSMGKNFQFVFHCNNTHSRHFWPSVPTPQRIQLYRHDYHVPMLQIESTLLFPNIFITVYECKCKPS